MKKAQVIIFLTIILIIILIFMIKQEDKTIDKFGDSQVEQIDRLEVIFLDIGQGDATLINFPDSQQMLVDCAIDARIIESLGRNMDFYDRKIDYLLITHPDLDHYGGCIDVLERFEIGHIIYNGFDKSYDDFWLTFMQSVEQEISEGAKYTIIEKEDVWEIADTQIHFMYPDHPIDLDSGIPGLNTDVGPNDTSIIFKLTHQDYDFLFTADGEEDLEHYLIETYGEQLDVEVLKAGHHGSGTSSITEFVSSTSPLYTIISAGKNNNFGHPSRRVLKRLERAGSRVLRTDLEGDIIIRIENGGLVTPSGN